MNHHTSRHPLPSLVGHLLTDTTHYIDNLFASAWKSLNLNRRLQDAGFAKRSGFEVTETVFVLMVWKSGSGCTSRPSRCSVATP